MGFVVMVEVAEEHLKQGEQEAWSVAKEELHVDVILGWVDVVEEPVVAEHLTVQYLNSLVAGCLL